MQFFFIKLLQDSDGRCFSDSLADLPGMLRRKGVDSENIPFSIDEMKRNVDKVSIVFSFPFSIIFRSSTCKFLYFLLFESFKKVFATDDR